MEAYIKQLRDDEGNTIYPVSKAEAVYIHNGIDTVERAIADLMDSNATIKMDGDKITKTLDVGGGTVIEFGGTSIKETTKNTDGSIIRQKTTTFNVDGSIRIEVQ